MPPPPTSASSSRPALGKGEGGRRAAPPARPRGGAAQLGSARRQVRSSPLAGRLGGGFWLPPCPVVTKASCSGGDFFKGRWGRALRGEEDGDGERLWRPVSLTLHPSVTKGTCYRDVPAPAPACAGSGKAGGCRGGGGAARRGEGLPCSGWVCCAQTSPEGQRPSQAILLRFLKGAVSGIPFLCFILFYFSVVRWEMPSAPC